MSAHGLTSRRASAKLSRAPQGPQRTWAARLGAAEGLARGEAPRPVPSGAHSLREASGPQAGGAERSASGPLRDAAQLSVLWPVSGAAPRGPRPPLRLPGSSAGLASVPFFTRHPAGGAGACVPVSPSHPPRAQAPANQSSPSRAGPRPASRPEGLCWALACGSRLELVGHKISERLRKVLVHRAWGWGAGRLAEQCWWGGRAVPRAAKAPDPGPRDNGG